LRPEPLRLVVAGTLVGVPRQGGATWAVLQWVLGLRALGHDVMVVEPVDALTPRRRVDHQRLTASFALGGRYALVTPERHSTGVAYRDVAAWCAGADALVNLAGSLTDRELVAAPSQRWYVDLDPGFTQAWHATGVDVGLTGHTAYVTVGLNVGRPGCRVPTGGLDWITAPPPIHLPAWDVAARRPAYGLTTVAHWRSYGSLEHAGVSYGQKAHSWRAVLGIAGEATLACEPALAIHPAEVADLAALARSGWHLHDPDVVAATPRAYHRFVGASTAELAIAKLGYVASRSGWFSDRSACYLARGRPVIAQDTGFSEFLPSGCGLLAFASTATAVEAIRQVTADYTRHRRAARGIAEEHFRADRVLRHVIERAASRDAPAAIPTADPPSTRSSAVSSPSL
jgi:hypothetical protein